MTVVSSAPWLALSDDSPPERSVELSESRARSSLSAPTDTCGGPSECRSHVDASVIQTGTSRQMPARSSTWTNSLPPLRTRRITGTRWPYIGCHLYSMTTVPNRYAECRSLLNLWEAPLFESSLQGIHRVFLPPIRTNPTDERGLTRSSVGLA